MQIERKTTPIGRPVKNGAEVSDVSVHDVMNYERTMISSGLIAPFGKIPPLRGTDMQRHHLIHKCIVERGPQGMELSKWIPAVPLTYYEHQVLIHRKTLNPFLKSYGFDIEHLDMLSGADVVRAVEAIGQYYSMFGLKHFANAVTKFQRYYEARIGNL
jgi:hypothetical protein